MTTTAFRGVFCGAVLWLVAFGSTNARADDWPQFRGPNREGISRETGWLTRWTADGSKVLWKVPVGRGYSSVAVAKDRLYTLGLLRKDPAKKDSFQEVVQCLDAGAGKPVWEFVSSTSIDKSFRGRARRRRFGANTSTCSARGPNCTASKPRPGRSSGSNS